MPRETLDLKLKELKEEIIKLGEMVENAITRSIDVLKRRDLKEAERLIEDDMRINEKRHEIEKMCINLIATQQPMASDLRRIIAALVISLELERIGDHAEGIAKITIMLGEEPPIKPLIDIPRMADKTKDMLRRSLKAFMEEDEEEARKICFEDDEVDMLYDQVFRELISFMIEDPRLITRATRLLWVAHNLERMADRVTNICERTVFTITGKLEEIGSSKY